MPESDLLSPRQVSEYLSTTAQEVARLVEDGKLNAYRIGGTFLRFKRDEVISFREEYLRARQRVAAAKDASASGAAAAAASVSAGRTLGEQLNEYWYFNNFYVFCFLVIGVLLYFILK